MEDGYTEDERLLHPVKVETEVEEEMEKKEHKAEDGERVIMVGEGKEGKYEEKGGGLLNHIISSLVSPRGDGGNNQEKVNQVFESTSKDHEEIGSKAEEDNNTEGGGSGGEGGGLIKNVISNLFHPGEEENKKDNKEEVVKEKDVEEKERRVTATEEEDVGGVGGVIDNIVSRLPSSIDEVTVAPTTDEASILIHSIIHD